MKILPYVLIESEVNAVFTHNLQKIRKAGVN
jgi:hypothetical protein